MSPLPRAYQWADGSAYVNHVELLRKSRGAELPESFRTDPLIYQGGSDGFLGPREDIRMASEDWGIDFEAEIAVVTDDVPMGIAAGDAGGHIKLLMLVNDVSLRRRASRPARSRRSRSARTSWETHGTARKSTCRWSRS
jgi:fumarylacetoacetate (FAA) hydrolase